VDFARGSMRTYLILKEKAERFGRDPEIQQILGELRSRGDGAAGRFVFSGERVRELKEERFDLPAMRSLGCAYERLDQLTTELLLGVR
jgi:xylose isomerase